VSFVTESIFAEPFEKKKNKKHTNILERNKFSDLMTFKQTEIEEINSEMSFIIHKGLKTVCLYFILMKMVRHIIVIKNFLLKKDTQEDKMSKQLLE
jgi:hypothetical protein